MTHFRVGDKVRLKDGWVRIVNNRGHISREFKIVGGITDANGDLIRLCLDGCFGSYSIDMFEPIEDSLFVLNADY